MKRRAMLTAAGLGVSLTGCLRLNDGGTDTAASTERESATRTATDPATASTTATETEESTETSRATLEDLACPADRSLSGAATDDWGQPQSDAASTGYVPEESVGTSAACVAWRQEDVAPVSTAVVLSDSHVFVGGEGREGLRALDRTTGEQAWTTDSSLSGVINVRNPLVVDGTVYFTAEIGAEGGRVFAFDAETGEERWRMEPAAGVGNMGPVRHEDGVLYGTSWIADTDAESVVWALDTAARTTRWKTRLDGRGLESCAVGNGRVYVAGDKRAAAGVQALDANTGEVLWRAVDAQVAGAPTVTGNAVYATTNDTRDAPSLFALDPETGGTRWTYETLNGTDCSVIATDDTVTYRTSDGLFCLGTDGAGRWRYTGRGARSQRGSPVRVGETIVVGSTGNDPGLVAVDANTGDPQWSIPTPEIPMTPAVVDGDVYVMYRTSEDWKYHLMALRTT
ncbi:PQQ-binding-like beta-propeller repeat protein [Halorubellus litoreus]|uniref:PQQ-binding-like beta-propeller repeat protein n=1 Tax=Halorubellus litoreus TaxID=755308 RepID=A0ABD5VKL5_9EURY